MWAEWLRQGLAAGRSTTSYPRSKEKLPHLHPGWFRVPVGSKPCNGCQACLQVCPNEALVLQPDGDSFTIQVHSERCLACNRCLDICPEGALSAGDLDRAKKTPLLPGLSNPSPGSDAELWEKTNVKAFGRIFRRSFHIRHIDTGSCNACETEILALSNPYYNLHRLGFFFTASPRHADVLLVTGTLTKPMKNVLVETYQAMPKPRFVIACGACALSGGVFAASARRAAPLAELLPVDAEVPGCPPNPYALLNALTLAAGKQTGGAVG